MLYPLSYGGFGMELKANTVSYFLYHSFSHSSRILYDTSFDT